MKTKCSLSMFTTAGHIGPVNTVMTGHCNPFVLKEKELTSAFFKQTAEKGKEKSRECHNHKPQPFPDPKRKRKPTNPNKHKSNKRTKRLALSSPSEVIAILKGLKTQDKMTHGKTYNKSPRRINHKATKSKTNTGTTALERSVE